MLKNKKLFSIISIIFVILIFLLINSFITGFTFKSGNNVDIKSVKKVLSTNYSEVKCVDTSCDYVLATKGDELNKMSYSIYNLNGKKVSSFTDNGKKGSVNVISASKKFIIISKEAKDKTYYVLNSNGKEIYSSTDKIEKVSDYLIAVSDGDNYKIINYKGKKVFKNVSSYDSFVDDKIVNIKEKDNYYVLDESGKIILKKCKLSRRIHDKNGKTLYYILENTDTSKYNYYDVNNKKVVGEYFDSYNVDSNNKVTIVKTKGMEIKRYILKENGKQEKYEGNSSYNKISKKIDSSKYYLYSYGIKSEKQKNVAVNDKNNKSFGIYNIDTGKYKELIKYKDDYIFGATVNEVESEDSSIVKITCNTKYCEKNTSIIYNLSNNETIYTETGDNVIVYYAGYNNGYKVIKYSSDAQTSGQCKVLDKDNDEVYKSDSIIFITDKKMLYSSNLNGRAILYSTSKNKSINDEKNLANIVKINGKRFFRVNSFSKTLIYSIDGKEVANVKSNDYITYSNDYIIFKKDKKINIYNTNNSRTKSYKLKENEKMENEQNTVFGPYKGTLFINNYKSKYSKVISSKGRVIRKITDGNIDSIEKSDVGATILIIKQNNKYGLYVAK